MTKKNATETLLIKINIETCFTVQLLYKYQLKVYRIKYVILTSDFH